jgi:Type VI secretion system/phage-baseplate injector OB domain
MTLPAVQELQEEVGQLKKFITELNSNLGTIVKTSFARNFSFISQDNTLTGMYTALVVDTFDVFKQNRIRYFNPILINPLQSSDLQQSVSITSLPWAFPISTFGGFDDSGSNWIPPAGSTVCLIFENGNRRSAYYIGTTWSRNRGKDGSSLGIPVPEFNLLYHGRGENYLVGATDGSQVFPPWNTESYNGYDITSISDVENNLDYLKRATFPNIYGMKTPEKHMIKMVDGDGKCNRKWKRMELMSGCGNWMIFKDDHLHYCGQWSHPSEGAREGDSNCYTDVTDVTDQTDVTEEASQTNNFNVGQPIPNENINTALYDYERDIIEPGFPNSKETPTKFPKPVECPDGKNYTGGQNVIGGAPDTPYTKSQKGSNPFFKAKNECRPIRGVGTPQNNKCDLPQSGIQLLSISGHTFVMDDSVEQPTGTPNWQRSLKDFDFGCSDLYLGRTYWKSCTGHIISMNDVEQPKKVRTAENGIKFKTALGNEISLCDETMSSCPGIGGPNRGISMNSTSNHVFKMIDEGVFQQSMQCRKDGNVPESNADKAYVQLRSGYGLELYMSDRDSQKETKSQFIRINAPQTDNKERGPHTLEMQETPVGRGYVFLRAGGNYLTYSYDSHYEIVGDSKNNPADKLSMVTKDRVSITSNYDYRVNDYFFNASKKRAYLLGGLGDCQNNNGGDTYCIYPIIVYDKKNNKLKISDRIFGSCSDKAETPTLATIDPIAEGNQNGQSNQNNQNLVI